MSGQGLEQLDPYNPVVGHPKNNHYSLSISIVIPYNKYFFSYIKGFVSDDIIILIPQNIKRQVEKVIDFNGT